MSASGVKVRKDLSADGLISMIREGFDAIPDTHLRENQDISLSDALMSAFAMFSLKDPSLLAFDERRRDPNDNFRSIDGIQHVPCDTQMRTILDSVEPETLYPLFTEIFNRVQRGKGLDAFVFFDGHYLISPDGTGYFSSNKIISPGSSTCQCAGVLGDSSEQAGVLGDSSEQGRQKYPAGRTDSALQLFHAFSIDSMAALFEAIIVSFVRQKPMLHARTTNFTVRLIFAILGTANRLNFPAKTNLIPDPFPTFVNLR